MGIHEPLRGASVALEPEPAGPLVGAMLDALASGTPSGNVEREVRALRIELGREPDPAQRVVDWLLVRDSSPSMWLDGSSKLPSSPS